VHCRLPEFVSIEALALSGLMTQWPTCPGCPPVISIDLERVTDHHLLKLRYQIPPAEAANANFRHWKRKRKRLEKLPAVS
jgi:hypothetical protein